MEIVFGLVLIGGIAYALLGRRADFSIRLRKGEVRIEGRVLPAPRSVLKEFFERDLGHLERVKISGRRSSDGRLHLRFRGRISEGDKQRIRNFLVNVG